MALKAAEIFRRNVRLIIDEKGETINHLAIAVGTSRPAMSRILSGIDGVTLDRAERIARALEIPLASLLEENFRKLPIGA